MPKTMRTLGSVVLILAISSARLAAQDDFDTRYDRFRLYTACLPLRVVAEVEDLEDELEGLTEESIERAVRSRLRSARVYSGAEFGPYLRANVQVVGRAFRPSLTLYKYLEDPLTGEIHLSASWSVSGTGTHGQDAQYVRGIVSEQMDEFIDEYLRVNEADCTNR